MILSKKPLTLAEVDAFVPKGEEKKPIHDYLKKFNVLSKKDALELAESIRGLNNPKIKESHVIKIVDFLPKDVEDVNKILFDAGLTEAESNAIVELVKKY